MKHIQLKVNGRNYHVLIKPDQTLADVLRNELHLTGTKVGCEQGTCGACTVVANSEAVLSCITPAARYDGREITTIEGVASGDSLHPLQEEMVKHGAIQCGFCTPGMVMASLAFLQNNPSPSKQEIRESISGNLCRCTGYKKIVEAIESTAERLIKEPHHNEQAFIGEPSGVVGKPRPYIDAQKKVTGTAQFADDLRHQDALQCKFLRSPHAHAKIKSIDIKTARVITGVRYIALGEELPEKFGVLAISRDQRAMAIEKVIYIGEIIAGVAADSVEIAEQAVRAIKVEYEQLSACETISDSLKPIADGDETIHPHCREGANIHKKASLRFGDQKNGLAKADVKCEREFEFDAVTHAFTEPHACTAVWDRDGKLTVTTATQVPHYLHRAMAKVLEIPLQDVRIIKPSVGGGFGGKSDPFAHEIIAAHLARKTGKPVTVCFSREEVFLTNHGRHPTELKMSIGADKEGNISVLDADIKIDGGAAGSFGVVTTYYNGVLLQAPYKIDNVGFDSCRVYTNKPPSGAMRGHGAVNPRYAVEVVLDEIAEEIKIDPCDLRLKNLLPANCFTVGQYRITSNGSKDAVRAVRQQSDWDNKFKKLPYGEGIGIACGFYISGSALPIIWNKYPQSVVHLKVDFDGRVVIYSGASDIGQGSDTMLAIVVAEVLGLQLDSVYVHAADTLFTPVDLGSYSSRVTFMAGNAAKMAAENLRADILEGVATATETDAKLLRLEGGKAISEDGSISLNWLEAIEHATADRGALNSSGFYISPKLGGDFKGAGAGLSPSYSFGAVITQVKVNSSTGQVDVLDIWGAHDCGKALNPLAVEGQLEGSWHMGVGQAISETMRYYKGLNVNANFLNYKIPTALDTPPIHTNIIESIDPEGPFGAKECGEGALHPVNPAIANAIYDAIGVRLRKLPIKPEDILRGIEQQKEMK